MAGAKKTLDPRTQKPENKTEVTKAFMEKYMELVATPEEVDWFCELIEKPENRKMYKSSLTQKEYEDIDIPKVRKAFCDKFYPYLLKKKETGQPAPDFTTRIKKLRDGKK